MQFPYQPYHMSMLYEYSHGWTSGVGSTLVLLIDERIHLISIRGLWVYAYLLWRWYLLIMYYTIVQIRFSFLCRKSISLSNLGEFGLCFRRELTIDFIESHCSHLVEFRRIVTCHSACTATPWRTLHLVLVVQVSLGYLHCKVQSRICRRVNSIWSTW